MRSPPADLAPIIDIQLDHLRERLAQPPDPRSRSPRPPGQRIAERGYDPAFGARPLKRVIQREVADPLASALLEGSIADGAVVVVDADPDGVSVSSRDDES